MSAKRHCGKSIIILFFLLLFSFIICMQSPINPFSAHGTSWVDSSVFKYIGGRMAKGDVPYKDMFDHKGPIIYFLNLIGYYIAPNRGIWVIEFIFMFLSLLGAYKVARLFCSAIQSLFIVMIAMSLIFSYLEGGNLVEEYAMTFQIWAIYIYIEYLINDRITGMRVVLCGIFFACVLFLRPNMISVWIVFSIAVLLRNIKEKNLKNLIVFLTEFICGMALIIIPSVVYLLLNNAFIDFWFDYIKFNIMYSGTMGGDDFYQKAEAFFFFLNTKPVLIAVLLVCWSGIKESGRKKRFAVLYAGYMLFTLFIMCLAGKSFPHYGMTIIPMLIYPYTILFQKCAFGGEWKEKRVEILVVGILIITVVGPVWMGGAKSTVNKVLHPNAAREAELQQVIEYIIDNTEEDAEITVWGNANYIYTLSGRKSASKYSYQFPIQYVDSFVLKEYFEEIEENNPEIVVVIREMSDKMERFLDGNGYEMKLDLQGYDIYVSKPQKN